MERQIYLFPETLGFGGFNYINDGILANEMVEVKGFKLITFLKRLDCADFQSYCVAVASKNSSSYFVSYKILNPPDFSILGFTTTKTEHGVVVHMLQSELDKLDKEYIAFAVKRSRNWIRERDFYHSVAAMHHLGIIKMLSPPIFTYDDHIVNWQSTFNHVYGTYGDLIPTIKFIYKRMMFAMELFCVYSVNENHYLSRDCWYCFGSLYPILKDSYEISALRSIIPGCVQEDNPFIILNTALKTVFMLLNSLKYNIVSIDNKEGFIEAVQSFQKSHGLPPGNCDTKTLRKLVIKSDLKRYEQLPIFKLANIEIELTKEIDFPMIKQVNSFSSDKHENEIKQQINNAITAIPDPASKLNWLNNEIEKQYNTCKDKCHDLSSRMTKVESCVSNLSEKLKTIIESSSVASQRVETAAEALKEMYDHHNKVQTKFDKLREKLLEEQRNTRLILFIGFIILIAGTFGFRQ